MSAAHRSEQGRRSARGAGARRDDGWDVVVVGASAGGVEALGVLLPYLAQNYPLPVVVVVHLRPDVPSLLPDVFGPRSALPVVEAEDKMPVTGGCIYVAPPDYHLMVERDAAGARAERGGTDVGAHAGFHAGAQAGQRVGSHAGPPGSQPGDPRGVHFALSVDPPVRFSRPSIDVLFESAAYVWRERVLGILLSGANDDGARGLQAIRANGGRAWVQAPETAASETMPAEAIVRGAADSVLTLKEIGRALRRAHPG